MYADGRSELLDKVWDTLIGLQLFRYTGESPAQSVGKLNEFLGTKLLPGIVVTSLAMCRALAKNTRVFEQLVEGRLKATFSMMNIVPDPNLADVIVVGSRLFWKDELEMTAFPSPDDAMRLFKVTPKRTGEAVDCDTDEALVVLIPQLIGAGSKCLELAVEYAKNRTAFGKPIGSYQAIKHKLVDDAVELELAHSLYEWSLSNRSCMQKTLSHVLKKTLKVATDAIQVHGGIGFTNDLDLHLYLRRCVTIGKLWSSSSRV